MTTIIILLGHHAAVEFLTVFNQEHLFITSGDVEFFNAAIAHFHARGRK